jgi:uncharacterized tellurite resistance protein B-like protein
LRPLAVLARIDADRIREVNMSFRFTSEELIELTEEQREMVLDVVIGAVLADGTPDSVDVSTFEADLLDVPWGVSDAEMGDKIQDSFDRVAACLTPRASVDFVLRAREVITDQNIRTKTLALAAKIAYLDGNFTKNEDMVLSTFAHAFEVPIFTVKEICESLMKGE